MRAWYNGAMSNTPTANLPPLHGPFDPEAALAHLRAADATMAAIIDMVGPYTLHHEPQGFLTLVDAIVSQQISVKAADAIMKRIVAAIEPLTPEMILLRAPEDLRALGLSNQKARYILDLAAHVHNGTVDLTHLPSLDDEAIIRQLIQVKGIGRWTAEMYLIFSLGRADVLPVDDLGLRQGVQRAYQLDELPRSLQIHAIAAPWRPYRSVATWYLWRSLSVK